MMNWAARSLMLRIVVFAALWTGDRASAHDTWANGDPIPAWVKAACCGPSDAHRLEPSQAHREGTSWVVDGLPGVRWSEEKVFESQDGYVWAFYKTYDGGLTYTFCLFVPLSY